MEAAENAEGDGGGDEDGDQDLCSEVVVVILLANRAGLERQTEEP